MTQILKSSLQEINEIILATGLKTMTIPASTAEKVESIAHGYGKAPFFTYSISYDDVTYFAGPNGQIGDDNRKNLFLYTDKNNVYFHYVYSNDLTIPTTPVTYYVRYKLYLTEAN